MENKKLGRILKSKKALPKRKDGYIFNPKIPSHCAGFFRARNKIARKLQKAELTN
ncbi:MAG: hypothetical protein NUK63_06555 [Candidatus Bathyarchaeum tardum]|nr:MAG: hypothetical protein NUK63_06555 [Candidatus Bathyarchaeum tardum]